MNITKEAADSQIEIKLVLSSGEREGEGKMGYEVWGLGYGMKRYKLLYRKQISSKESLYSTGK